MWILEVDIIIDLNFDEFLLCFVDSLDTKTKMLFSATLPSVTHATSFLTANQAFTYLDSGSYIRPKIVRNLMLELTGVFKSLQFTHLHYVWSTHKWSVSWDKIIQAQLSPFPNCRKPHFLIVKLFTTQHSEILTQKFFFLNSSL